MLVGKVLRSPYAHAKILSVDTSKAEALPGVKAIVTYKDFPIISGPLVFGNEMGNSRIMAENMFATEKVLYKGHAIAAVAATDAHIAEEAIGLIDVKYEPLEPVLTVHDAMREGAPILHDTMTTLFKVERFGKGEDTGVKSNVASQIQFKRGDLDKAFGESELVIEREFNTKTVHQGYIEPHSSTASWSQDGRLTVWTSTQGIFGIRDATAAILGIPASQVKVVAMEIGGGFGGKTLTYIDPVVAQLSKKTGRPVKITMTRKEVFEGTGPTSGTYMRLSLIHISEPTRPY